MRVAAMGFVILVLVALTFMTLVKYWQLTSVVVDGDGIGVYFLGFELNDRVPAAEIPRYANGFLVASVALGLSCVAFAHAAQKKWLG